MCATPPFPEERQSGKDSQAALFREKTFPFCLGLRSFPQDVALSTLKLGSFTSFEMVGHGSCFLPWVVHPANGGWWQDLSAHDYSFQKICPKLFWAF